MAPYSHDGEAKLVASYVVINFFAISVVALRFYAIYLPVAQKWDKTIINGYCGDEATAELAAAAFNVALDIVIVALPLPVVWHLQLRTHKKVAVTTTFGLGLGISAINLARVHKVITCSLVDFTFCTLDSAILTVAEMGVGITVACVPSLAPLIRRPNKASPGSSKK
ncbi:hypothetical protein GQX73_g9654 [Xylaria multiplex]|uniref:Rhodopsin domain-containing protein n=1 Tax=Xylaria multiplex TaxID=323545 RepID=A0A7C8IHM1_9PEZI|nr:hypothetical protein GQX73_g9654 [Xylaria multiplex]